MEFNNLDSTAITNINVTGEDVNITYKGSGKTYRYLDTTGNFVNLLQNVIESNQSVGRFVNKAVREDQTLRIVTVWPLNNTNKPQEGVRLS